MPIQAKADNNVPFLPGRARYSVVARNPSWVYHEMAAGQTMAGEAPRSATKDESEIDPTVGDGKASWTELTKGGLFTLVGNYKLPIICEAVVNPGSATLALVGRDGTQIRTMPTTCPFYIAPGETIKAVGGGAGGKVGFLLRADDKRTT